MSAWDEVDEHNRRLLEKASTSVAPDLSLKPTQCPETGVRISSDRLRTQRALMRIRNGFHPNGRRLLVPIVAGVNQTCGGCASLREKETPARRKFFKCALMGDTNGPATDIRKSWPGCDLWKAAQP